MAKPTTLIVSGIVCILIAVGIGWIAFPRLFHSKIIEAKQLKKGNQMRKDWTNIPMAVDFKIWLFNITNPDEVQNGGKPTVKEVGPYFYREWKSKVNLEDDPNDDTITYNLKNTFYFDAKESKPLTGNELITIPHLLILAFVQLTLQIKPSAINMVNKGIPHIFGNPKSIFLTATAKDILFDGVTVNCTKSKEFAANALCDQIRDKPDGLKAEDDGTFKFSMLGTKNGTADTNKITVKRGIKDIQQVGEVVMYNGKTEMDYWNGLPCNEVKGSDTTMFPPFMDTENPKDIWNFGAEVCRSLPAKFVEHTTFKGIKGMTYEADLGDMSTDPELKCFCPTNTTCLKQGTYDVQKCIGAPIIMTLPHCYKCHPDYLNDVNGLNPKKEIHGIFSIFEPVTGTPVSGRRRLQFNMFVYRVPKITVMKNLTEEKMLVPIMWVEEGLELNDTLAATVRHLLYRPVKIVKVTRMLLLIGGIVLLILAIFAFYKRTKLCNEGIKDDTKPTITQVSPAY